MKTFVLCLLFLSSLCFALGDEEAKNENDFIDVDSDEGEVPDNEQLPEEDEEENDMEDSEDDEDFQEDEENDEPEDPNGFKDDSPEDAAAPEVDDSLEDAAMKEKTGRPIIPLPTEVEPIVEATPSPSKPSEGPGSGLEPNNDAELDVKEALEDKLGLK